MKYLRSLPPTLFMLLGLVVGGLFAAEAPPAATAPASPLVAENAELKAKVAHLEAQVAQLAAGIRKLQEQRDLLARQLLDAEVQRAISDATPAAASPTAQPTALAPQK